MVSVITLNLAAGHWTGALNCYKARDLLSAFFTDRCNSNSEGKWKAFPTIVTNIAGKMHHQ
jgi:hypothetical protein